MSLFGSPTPRADAMESNEERSASRSFSRASASSSDTLDDDDISEAGRRRTGSAHADGESDAEGASRNEKEEAEKFLWGASEGEVEDEEENDLLDAEDYIQGSASSAANRTTSSAPAGAADDGEAETYDEEVPYAPRVLLKDSEARSRKEKLLLAAFNSLTHTEVVHAHAASADTAPSANPFTAPAEGVPTPAATAAPSGSEGASSDGLSRRPSNRARLLSQPASAPPLRLSSSSSARHSWGSQRSAVDKPALAQGARGGSLAFAAAGPPPAPTAGASYARRPGASSAAAAPSATGTLAPKMVKVMKEIFGTRKPVGRFGAYAQKSGGKQAAAATPAAAQAAQAQPNGDAKQAGDAAGPLASSAGGRGAGSQVSVTVTDEALRQLKDINLLLKREGCSTSLRRPRAQELYDFEDGHMLYQHPRFCATAIFRENLVARRLAPLWAAIAARYDAVEGSDDAQQIAHQQHLLVQLLRCLTFLAGPPPLDWIQYWTKFAPWLDELKRVDETRKKEKKRYEELRARRRRLGLEQPEAEKLAEKAFYDDETLYQDEQVKQERRQRSRIIMKYYRGMQDAKKALCCASLWQLLSSVFMDKQDFLDRGGRTAEQQRRLDAFVEEREALYRRERELKARLKELQDQEVQAQGDDQESLLTHRLRRASGGSRAALAEEARETMSELEDVRERIFQVTETLHDLNRSNREDLEKAETLLQNLRILVCAVLLIPPSLPNSLAVTPGTQLSLVAAMLQQKRDKALSSSLHPLGGVSLLHLLLRDTQSDLFAKMQKAFSLVELASSSSPQENEFYDLEKMTGGLGQWAVTHVHAELMERVWMVLRTVHGLLAAIPPLAFAELVAEIVTGVVSSSDLPSASSSSAPSSSSAGAPSSSSLSSRRYRLATLQDRAQKRSQRAYIQFLSRLDPLKARKFLLSARAVAAEQRNRRAAQTCVFRDQRRFVNYERLFAFRALALRPFDLEEENREEANPDAETGADAAPAAREEKPKAPLAALASKAAWMRTVFSKEEVLSLQKLVCGFLGIDELFTAPVNPDTHENDLYCGRFYSLAFLVEAGIKELLREVDTDYHCPWDAELLLNLISWVFAYEVTYFKTVNRLRLARARPSGSAALLDRIDLIFCLQGYETALIQDFLTSLLHRAVFVLSLARGSRPLLVSCLQCLRQLLRLLQVHVHSRKEEIVEAVKTQLALWIKRGVLGTLAHVMKNFKFSSFESDVFLYALEIVLIFVSLLQAIGGAIEVVGLPARGLGAPRKAACGRATAGLFGEDADELKGSEAFLGGAEEPGVGSGVRNVTVDDVVQEFLRGEIISQAMTLLSHYSTNAVAVNSAIVSFFELVLAYKGSRPENFVFFFDVSFFLVFRAILNDSRAHSDPRISWIAAFAEGVVERFFLLWGCGSEAALEGAEVASADAAEKLFGGASEGEEGAKGNNAFLPLELLFSKKKSAGRGGFGESPALELFCPTSDGTFASIASNYAAGSDALLLEALAKQKSEQGFFAPLDAAAECRRNLVDEAGCVGGRGAANKFDKHEDEMLIREYMTYRDINDWDKYIATTLGKTARAVRKRLQQLYLSNPELLPSDFCPDHEEEPASPRDAADVPAASAARAGLPPLLGSVLSVWDLFETLPESGSEKAEMEFAQLLKGLASNFADACRLREVLRMDAAAGAARDNFLLDDVTVEEPMEGGVAAVAVLASAEFAGLMQAMGAEKRSAPGRADAEDEGVWKIPPQHPQEVLEAAVKKLKELVDLNREAVEGRAAEILQREEARATLQSRRVRRRPFIFNSAALAEALLSLRLHLQRLEAEEKEREEERRETASGSEAGVHGSLFVSGATAETADAASQAAASAAAGSPFYALFGARSADAVVADLLGVFQAVSEQLAAREEAAERDPEGSLELRVEQFAWFGFEAIGEGRDLRKTLSAMGCFRDFSRGDEGETEEGAPLLWQLPLDVDAEIFEDRVEALRNFASKDIDELDVLIQGIRGDRAPASREAEEEEGERVWGGADEEEAREGFSRKKKHRRRQRDRAKRLGGGGGSPSRRRKERAADHPVVRTLASLMRSAAPLPRRPTTRHRYLLAAKLLVWREFLESDPVHRDLLQGDRPLQRLLASLRRWNAEREAVVAEAAAAAEDSADEAEILTQRQVPHLVLSAASGREEERDPGAVADPAETEEDGAEGGGDRTRGEENEAGGVRFRVVHGVLPSVAAGLWVCAALGGKPVEASENREFVWRAEETALPSSWLRKQLRILELVLLNPQMQTAAGVQVELRLIKEAMEREEDKLRRRKEEEEMRRRSEDERAEEEEEEEEPRRCSEARRSDAAEADMEDPGAGSDQEEDGAEKPAQNKRHGEEESENDRDAREDENDQDDDFDLVPESADTAASPQAASAAEAPGEEGHSELDEEDYKMFLPVSDNSLSEDDAEGSLFDAWDAVGSEGEEETPQGAHGDTRRRQLGTKEASGPSDRGRSRGTRADGGNGENELLSIIDDLQSLENTRRGRAPAAPVAPSGNGEAEGRRKRDRAEGRDDFAAEGASQEEDIDRVKRLMRGLESTFAELKEVRRNVALPPKAALQLAARV
ncbi:hypothetical protein BESB_033630 [Besnoitia besnoiti]|uniref:Uncharacterized protein n=1 Tax=Besnoitia besnoiti TaxID=94643 RepID=A0A2A9MFY2_BESBE|nr:hypothetical protein BESB_033630 [Besnoitia besnoiti]PFH36905.1 hypothetical protein BESB_033630 [Besnoitia besnoiti]